MTAGLVGRSHGHDGSFWVERAKHPLPLGSTVAIGSREHRIERRAGDHLRPLLRLAGVTDPRSLRGQPLLVDEQLADGEWLAADLVGASVPGHGRVVRLLDGPSCSVLELEDGLLVPFVSDAIRSVGDRVIELNEDFLA